ncbi:hypothetical protein MUK42_30931, partial [Musa troglodytarum]
RERESSYARRRGASARYRRRRCRGARARRSGGSTSPATMGRWRTCCSRGAGATIPVVGRKARL